MEFIKGSRFKDEETKKNKKTEEAVAAILEEVRSRGDEAVREYTRRFDGGEAVFYKVPEEEINKAQSQLARKTLAGLHFAAEQIESFARSQLACIKPLECEYIPGVTLGHRIIPVDSCGAYVPGGRYPLPSSALMSVIPARIAGVRRIIACSPPVKGRGMIHPAVLTALRLAGAHEIYCMGGAQAIAAMAYGTGSIPPVDLIVGPGNAFVTEAKRQLAGRVGIDMLAGPSEVLIIADETASPSLVALDILAQCEHDPSSRGILITTSRALAEEAVKEAEVRLKTLATAETASRSWQENSCVILVDSFDEAVEISDKIAPEHLLLQTYCNEALSARVKNYGSLFLGNSATVAFGDYVSGTNHILPTMGCSRFTNGVWAGTFLKIASFQKVSPAGAAHLAVTCAHLAEIEGLTAHRLAAEARKEK